MSRISSLDPGYASGQLSVYPQAYDDYNQLYTAVNNGEQVLKHTLPYGATQIVVEDASSFPSSGLVRLGKKNSSDYELVYFGSRTNSVLSNLIRGFAGSRQNAWPAQITYVFCGVMADYHNAVKDAILNMENYVGIDSNPLATSLNGILTSLENTYLAPSVVFRAYPVMAPPQTNIVFQNFCEGNVIRYLWDFGDGSKSIERNPVHSYMQEGNYTVQLTVITDSGSQGISVKSNYITASKDAYIPFFYILPLNDTPNYSQTTANNLSLDPQIFSFVDQTDGDIVQRYWIFGDGDSLSVTNPNEHTTTHIYQEPGSYSPTLLLIYGDNTTRRAFLNKEVVAI